MSKIFYDHLTVIEEIITILDTHNLNRKERYELLSLIDQTMNQNILDEILTNLPKSFHKKFLQKFHDHPGDRELLIFLKENSPRDIEQAIIMRANTVKKDLIQIIKGFESKS